jgi:hypothetical protein
MAMTFGRSDHLCSLSVYLLKSSTEIPARRSDGASASMKGERGGQ